MATSWLIVVVLHQQHPARRRALARRPLDFGRRSSVRSASAARSAPAARSHRVEQERGADRLGQHVRVCRRWRGPHPTALPGHGRSRSAGGRGCRDRRPAAWRWPIARPSRPGICQSIRARPKGWPLTSAAGDLLEASLPSATVRHLHAEHVEHVGQRLAGCREVVDDQHAQAAGVDLRRARRLAGLGLAAERHVNQKVLPWPERAVDADARRPSARPGGG